MDTPTHRVIEPFIEDHFVYGVGDVIQASGERAGGLLKRGLVEPIASPVEPEDEIEPAIKPIKKQPKESKR